MNRTDGALMIHLGGPDPQRAACKYRPRAAGYDASARRTLAFRRRAIDLLRLQPGDRVLDVACGTGLSFPRLREMVGERGAVVGVDVSAEMVALAQRRIAVSEWDNVRVVTAALESAALDGPYDALLFNYTHDVLQSPSAIANILAHTRPGARVALAGIKQPPAWLWPLRVWRIAKARPYVTTLRGLDAPWAIILPSLEAFEMRSVMLGTNYIASARVRVSTLLEKA